MTMASEFSGGCRCGSARYRCSAEPTFTGHCHCRDCQYASGGARWIQVDGGSEFMAEFEPPVGRIYRPET